MRRRAGERGSGLRWSGEPPRTKHYDQILLDQKGIYLSISGILKGERKLECQLVISEKADDPDSAFRQLREHRAEIERRLNGRLDWRKEEKPMRRKIVQWRPADLEERSEWPAYADWCIDKAEAFEAVFTPFLRAL